MRWVYIDSRVRDSASLSFGGPGAIDLAAPYSDLGARASSPVSRNLISGRTERQTPGYRVASEVALVAKPLNISLPDGPYDQEIMSLLLYQLRRSVFSNAISPGRIGRFPNDQQINSPTLDR